MPYADPEKRREVQRRSYRKRYAQSKAFREEEAARKAEWLKTEQGQESNRASSREHWRRAKRGG